MRGREDVEGDGVGAGVVRELHVVDECREVEAWSIPERDERGRQFGVLYEDEG